MIFELVKDFHDALAAMPRGHAEHRMLEMLGSAMATSSHVLALHPYILFQTCCNALIWHPNLPETGRASLAREAARRNDEGRAWLRSLCAPLDAAITLVTAQLSIPHRWFHFACWSGQDKRVLLGCGDGDLLLWDPSSGTHETLPNVHRSHVCPIKGRDMYRASRPKRSGMTWVAVASWDRRVHLVDVQTRELRLTVKAHSARVTGVVVLEEGLRFASCGWDKCVALFCAATGKELARWSLDSKATALAADLDGKLYAGTEDGGVFEIDSRASRIRRLRQEPGYVVALAYDAERNLLLAGGEGKNQHGFAAVSSASDGRRVWRHTQPGFVSAVVVHSPSGNAALASVDGTVSVLDLSKCDLRQSPRIHGGSVRSVEFSSDGTQLLTAGHDGTARLLSVSSIGDDSPSRAHGTAAMAVAVNACGTKAVSVAHQSRGRLLSLPGMRHEFDLDVVFWSLRDSTVGITRRREVPFEWVADLDCGGSWLNGTQFEASVPMVDMARRGLRGCAAMGQQLAVYATDLGAVLLIPMNPDGSVRALVTPPGSVRHALVSPKRDLFVLAYFANAEGILLLCEAPADTSIEARVHDSARLDDDLGRDTTTSMFWVDPDALVLAAGGSEGHFSCFRIERNSIVPVMCPASCRNRLHSEVLADDRTAAVWRGGEPAGFFASDQPLVAVVTSQCPETLSLADREGQVWHMATEGTGNGTQRNGARAHGS